MRHLICTIFALIALLCAQSSYAFFSGRTFNVRVTTNNCNPALTHDCNARNSIIYVTGGMVSMALQTDAMGLLHLPIEIQGEPLNFNLINRQFSASTQQCYRHQQARQWSVVALNCTTDN